MDTDNRLEAVAAKYRSQGYAVVVGPGPDDLPGFAKDFRVEILASRDAGGVLASAKKNQTDLERDREIPRYAEVIEEHPGWRFDIFVLEADSLPNRSDQIVGLELSEEDTRLVLDEADRLRSKGSFRIAFIAAWSVLETAMRRNLRTAWAKAMKGSSPRTMLNELYSNGILLSSDYRELERLLPARNAIVHGFLSQEIGDGHVSFLIAIARKLLDESKTARTTD